MCFCWFEEAAGDILSAAEAQDLNEGRTHLRAVADRRGVPVFGTVKQAVENIFTQHTKTENNTAQSPKALKSEHVAGALEKEAFSEPSWHYISSKTRDIGKMVQAAEMVSGKNVDNLVLVIEEDEDAEKKDEQFALGQEIADEIISAAQAKDLNRAFWLGSRRKVIPASLLQLFNLWLRVIFTTWAFLSRRSDDEKPLLLLLLKCCKNQATSQNPKTQTRKKQDINSKSSPKMFSRKLGEIVDNNNYSSSLTNSIRISTRTKFGHNFWPNWARRNADVPDSRMVMFGAMININKLTPVENFNCCD